MASTTCTDHLCNISSDTWFVLGAYFFAFFPWVVLSNTDYITEKWRTVRRTRVLARYHVVFSIGPMMYVAVYAEAQRRVGDSKELGAALAALFLNLIHFVRTVWGMAQVNAFMAWCKDAMECLRAMQGNDDDGVSANDGSENSSWEEDEGDKERLEEKLMVNNAVVDNELGGTDVTVTVSWRKALEKLQRWELKPRAWLVTGHPQLCTIRWACAFLCGVGDMWCGSEYLSLDRPGEALSSFYSGGMFSSLKYLVSVTWKVEREGSDATIVSFAGDVYDSGRGTAYANDGYNTYLFDIYESFMFESDSLRSSYPVRKLEFEEGDNRDVAVAGLAESVVLAKNLGPEKLTAMRRYFDDARLPTNGIWRNGLDLLLEQCKSTPPIGSALEAMFRSLDRIPFPYRLQMVALWDKSTNWRVLQASAHCDINLSLRFHGSQEEGLFEIEPRPANVFDYCRALASDEFNEFKLCFTLGVVMETVRGFLGEWLSCRREAVDWEPLISDESFEFPVSKHVKESSTNINVVAERFVWECQRALQNDLANSGMEHRNLPSSVQLTMLFILSMPSISVAEEEGKDGEGTDGKRENRESSSTLAGEHSIVNVSVRVWRIRSRLAPQDISIIVRFDEETGRASLSLVYDGSSARFKWKDWLDAGMGYMRGMQEAEARHEGDEEENERPLRKVDLGKPMVELSPFFCDDEDSVMETGIVLVWTGWPALDVRICKFEMDQWLSACNIDMNNLDLDEDNDNYAVNEEVSRAESTIRKVIEGSLLDGRDET